MYEKGKTYRQVLPPSVSSLQSQVSGRHGDTKSLMTLAQIEITSRPRCARKLATFVKRSEKLTPPNQPRGFMHLLPPAGEC